MANILMGDILQVKVFSKVVTRSQKATQQLWYEVTGVTGAWTPFNAAAAMSQTHAILWKAYMGEQATYDGTSVKVVAPLAGVEAKSIAGQGPAVGYGQLAPGQVCALITARGDTYHAGSKTLKHNNGIPKLPQTRVYLSFPGAALTLDGSMHPQIVDKVRTIRDTVYDTRVLIFSGGMQLILSPRAKSVVANYLVDPPTRVTSYHPVFKDPVLAAWATQRRRGDRGQRELV